MRLSRRALTLKRLFAPKASYPMRSAISGSHFWRQVESGERVRDVNTAVEIRVVPVRLVGCILVLPKVKMRCEFLMRPYNPAHY